MIKHTPTQEKQITYPIKTCFMKNATPAMPVASNKTL